MLMNRMYPLLCLIALTNVSAPVAIAQLGAPPPVESEKVLRQLNLTDNQLLAIRNLRQKHQQKLQPLRQKLRQHRRELQAMLAGDATPEQLRAKYQEIGSLRQQIARVQFEQTLAIREILTPAQRTRLAEILQSRRRFQP
jgi:Spy/CpxP family protein refolding chaperone